MTSQTHIFLSFADFYRVKYIVCFYQKFPGFFQQQEFLGGRDFRDFYMYSIVASKRVRCDHYSYKQSNSW